MVDLHSQYAALKDEINQAIQQVLDSCAFILGPNVQMFEQEAATYLQSAHAVSCASGTDALHLALRALDIGTGDEVITPAFTFAATAEAIMYVGAKPVFCDIEADSYTLDVNQLESLITRNTKAVIAVHLYGHPARMKDLQALCAQHNLYIIEDCAQSFGASIEGKFTGSIGTFGCFSFFPSKNLGAYGDGGLITTQSDRLAERLQLLRNHGSRIRYQHESIGFNSRLDEIQAAILRVKLKHIDEFNQNRRKVAQAYSTLLDSTSVTTPKVTPGCNHVFHQYTIRSQQRASLQQALTNHHIAHAIYYPLGLHQQPAFRENSRYTSLRVTETVCDECLSLPIYPELGQAEITRICEVILSSSTTA